MELMIHKTLSKHLCYELRKTHIRENSGLITLNVKLQVLSLLFMFILFSAFHKKCVIINNYKKMMHNSLPESKLYLPS